MGTINASKVKAFVAAFVRAYWETVKSGKHSMPPNEPIEETVEELLAQVSHKVEIDTPSTGLKTSCTLHMSARTGDWWEFRFQRTAVGWSLVDALASAGDDAKPHDLLDTVYGPYFKPFLQHVTEVANTRTGM